jgi:hypothetical protein
MSILNGLAICTADLGQLCSHTARLLQAISESEQTNAKQTVPCSRISMVSTPSRACFPL